MLVTDRPDAERPPPPAPAPRWLLPRLFLTCGVLAAVLAGAVVLGIGSGPVGIRPGEVLAVLFDAVAPGWVGTAGTDADVVLYIRLPRVLVGALVGAALGIAGATMQAVFRNPLAEPGVIGISAGAALGAVCALYLGWTAFSRWALPGAAFAGAAATTALVFAIAQARRDRSTATLLLVGIAVSAFFGALISMMVATAASDDELRSIVFWLQGGLGARTWEHVRLAAGPVLLACAALVVLGRDLNVMLLGDEGARSSGIDVHRTRILLLTMAALLTGAAVAVSGVIGFVGLVVPHAIRLAVGPDNRILLPASALGGAAFLVLSDLVARTAFSPVSLQVGIVTALFGAPVFLALVLRRAGR